MKPKCSTRGRATSPRALARTSLALLLGATSASCAGPRPDPAAEQQIAQALGSSGAVTFRTQGGPLDEPQAGDQSLTLTQAVTMAALTDPGLQAALARVRIAMADADQSRLLPNPVLNLIFKFPTKGGKPGIEAELTADLASILRIPRQSSAADHRLRAAAAQAVTTALDVVAEVQERYAAVQALEELMPLLEQRMLLLSKLLQLAQDRLDAGEGTRSDVTTLQAQRVELEVEIAEKDRQRLDERLRVARLIGEPSSPAAWTVERWAAPAEIPANELAWIESGLLARPEIQAATWELAALGDDLALTRLAPWDGAAAGVKADRDPDWSIGPSLTTPIPVFDVGQAKRDKATAQQIEARHKLTQARRQVVEDIRRAFGALAASQANLQRVRKELIPLQEQRRSQAEDSYRSGQTDVTTLFLAEQDLQASLARQVELEQATAVSLVRLQRAVGGAGVAARVEVPPGTNSQSPDPIVKPLSTNNPK